MIEKKVEISMLYDFYSQLLTEKQRDMIDLYYNQDLSLGEIAEDLHVSRQAVYDTIKRTEKILYDYEKKLKLFHLFHSKMINIEKIQEKVFALENKINEGASIEELKKEINAMKLVFDELLNN
ncbi:YlxM family DNA-binding protein [Clostridium formicaceticum]|uniref:YlxM family DNA-binding protein n=1 Tax=Clostridium formicaceticum TaxID=1497 RepID=UPI003AAC2484